MRLLLAALWFLLCAACTKPGLVVIPDHVKGCSIPRDALAAGDQKLYSQACGEATADPVRHWLETYNELGYRLVAVTAIHDACLGDMFRILFRKGSIYLEIRSEPNLLQGVEEGKRSYTMRIQRSRFSNKSEPWRIKLYRGVAVAPLAPDTGPYGFRSCGPKPLRLDLED